MSRYQVLVAVVLLLCLLVCRSHAGIVRVLESNAKEMKPVFLSMGQSTVLRFTEKPKKIVVGNQNYFNIEFVDNDLAIQPLGSVTSNLFVYCEYDRVYGFILRPRGGQEYDDLVNVRWKPPGGIRIEREKKETTVFRKSEVGKRIVLKNRLELTFEKLSSGDPDGLKILEIRIRNLSNRAINIKELNIFASRKGKPLEGQSFVTLEDLLQEENSTRSRLFIRTSSSESFTVNAELGTMKDQIIIDRAGL